MKTLQLCLALIIVSNSLQANLVTYEFSNGRFGDNLLAYSHARWISYKYSIPLLYKPFEYSEKLKMHLQHLNYETARLGGFHSLVNFSNLTGKQNSLSLERSGNLIYSIPYFPHCEFDIKNRFHFDIDWKDEKFISILRSEIAPIDPIQPLDIPIGRHLVALHIRTGAGFDKILQACNLGVSQILSTPVNSLPSFIEQDESLDDTNNDNIVISLKNARKADKSKFSDKLYPLKFPPNEFYIEQLKNLSQMLNNEPMYVHIFTDSSQPQHLADLFSKELHKPNITFGYRKAGNKHNANVVEDFFALMQFDYLIRGESNFSIMAGILKDYKITIFPKTFSWDCNSLKIHEVQVLKQAK